MKIVRFDSKHPITHFDSSGATIGGVARCSGSTRVSILRLEAGGVVGLHEARSPQLFVVVEGSGTVRAADSQPAPIASGQAAFWEPGELHETATSTGLTAIVVESGEIQLL